MSVLGIIPARGGSKSIPRKNLKQFLDKPLLAWTIEAANDSGVLDRLILSTDDQEIAQMGQIFGAEAPFLRPLELAQDTTPTAPVIRQAVEWLKKQEGWTAEFVIILEPTSPGRRPFHISETVKIWQQHQVDSIASVSIVPHHYIPPKVLHLGNDSRLMGANGMHLRDMIHRRQDLPTYYALNGLIFACKTELVLQTPPTLWGEQVWGYVTDPKYSIDLDQPDDWGLAEFRLQPILFEEAQ